MKLPIDRFRNVVRDAVLVSLDLLIVNDKAEVLVGRRQNPPAKDWLFVPGGRVYKEERLTDALQRISVSETGVDLSQAGGAFTASMTTCTQIMGSGKTESVLTTPSSPASSRIVRRSILLVMRSTNTFS